MLRSPGPMRLALGRRAGKPARAFAFAQGRLPALHESALHKSERVHVGEQVLNFLGGEFLAVAGHFAASVTDDVADAFVVGGQPAFGEIGLLENSFQAGPFFSTRGIGLVAAVAEIIVDAATGSLLRVQAEFGIALTALGGAVREAQGSDKARRNQNYAN